MIPAPDYSEALSKVREDLLQLLKEVCPVNLLHRNLRKATRLIDDYSEIKNDEANFRLKIELLLLEQKLREEEEAAKLPLHVQLVREKVAKQQGALRILLHAVEVHCELRELLRQAPRDAADLDAVLRWNFDSVKRMCEEVIQKQTTTEDKESLRSALIDCAQDLLDECRDGLSKSAFPLKLILELGGQIGVTYDDVGTTQPEVENFLGLAE